MTTWNPNRASFDRAFSADFNTVTLNANPGGDHAGFGTGFNTSGKYVFKVTPTFTVAGNHFSCGVGTATASTVLNQYLGIDTQSMNWQSGSGLLTINSVNINGGVSIEGYTPGSVIYLAFDLTNQLFWGLVAGSANGWNFTNAAPDSGTGGVSISTLASMNVSPGYNIFNLNDSAILDTTGTGSGLTTFKPWGALVYPAFEITF